MNIFDFYNKKSSKEKISMVTCYDYWSAQILNSTNIDCLLVGDSLSMVMHGHANTLPADIDVMALHTCAVRRGAPEKFIIGDLPFLSYRKDFSSNVSAAEALMKSGANAIKLEGAKGNLSLIQHLTDSGVPVMGHLGLTPQSIHQLGGYRVQAKSDEAAEILRKEAKELEEAGCFSLVLECVPTQIAEKITATLTIPTIGIGAGPFTDGQVLVLHDLLGLNSGFQPKFLRTYLDGKNLVKEALEKFHLEVRSGEFPSIQESYE
ncbi:MAG: 3-methyl-2-oxobutanoate hydroxymethyltransferase [Bdellovibrionales bacterium]|nr:3-methyl-2-oxobutanoate hydroxymethyltransferase [Bdellovibrionales bacterium]